MEIGTLIALLTLIGGLLAGLYKIFVGDRSLLALWEERRNRQRICILPPQPVNFVNRETELKQIANTLHPSHRQQNKPQFKFNAVLIVGMGGIGKTDLALESAYQLDHYFKDGIVWQFAGQFSADDLINVIASAFDIKVSDTSLPQKKVIVQKALSGKNVLLIFDNAERAEPISEILNAVPSCKAIITSRVTLPISNTYRLSLSELPIDSAITLFERSLGRPLELAEHVLAEQICKRIGQLPLAIMLASKQVEMARIDISRVLFQIDHMMLDTLRSNISGDGGVRTIFETTYQLLDPLDQSVFAILGVFSEQGFSRNAMQSVTANPVAEGCLSRLIAYSLVKPLGNSRYLMHPLIKLYAQEKLQIGDAYQRMAEYFLQLASQNQNNFDVLEIDRSNILLALDWAQQAEQWLIVIGITEALLGPDTYYGFLAQRGYWDESLERTHQALEAATRLGDDAKVARFSADLGQFYYWQGKNDDARKHYQITLDRLEKLGNAQRMIQTLHLLGYIEDDEDNYAQARTLYERSLKLSEDLSEPELISLSRHLVGVVSYHEGKYGEARQLIEQSLKEELARNDQAAIARTRRRLAAVARMQGHYASSSEKRRYFDEARRLLGESLKTETILRSRARALRQLGMVAQEENELGEAFKYYSESLDIFTRLGNKKGIASVKCNLGFVYRERGNYKIAEQLCKESLEMARELRCRYGEALCLRELAWIESESHNVALAHSLMQQAVDVLKAIQSSHVEEFKSQLNLMP